jgi:hypothetical protein
VTPGRIDITEWLVQPECDCYLDGVVHFDARPILLGVDVVRGMSFDPLSLEG